MMRVIGFRKTGDEFRQVTEIVEIQRTCDRPQYKEVLSFVRKSSDYIEVEYFDDKFHIPYKSLEARHQYESMIEAKKEFEARRQEFKSLMKTLRGE